MTNYHGWTHRRKSDGGTDPIYPDGDEPWSGGAAGDTPWAWRAEVNTTDVPTDGSWTDIELTNGEIPPGQTAIVLDTDGIEIVDAGIYLVTLQVRFASGGTGGYCQTRLVFGTAGVPSGASILSSAEGTRDSSGTIFVEMTRLVDPGHLGPEIRVACRQTTSTIQTPNVMLSVVQITPQHNGSPNFPRL